MFTLFNLQGTLGAFDRFCSPLHRRLRLSSELVYYTAFVITCQELFSKFFRGVSHSLHIVSFPEEFVNTFFKLFQSFFWGFLPKQGIEAKVSLCLNILCYAGSSPVSGAG